MPDFVPLQQPGGLDRRAPTGPPQSDGPVPVSYESGAEADEDERGDSYAYTNFNPAHVAEQAPSGEISRFTWIMIVIAGVVLGGVMTFIAAGA
jgi:hypothetical protein